MPKATPKQPKPIPLSQMSLVALFAILSGYLTLIDEVDLPELEKGSLSWEERKGHLQSVKETCLSAHKIIDHLEKRLAEQNPKLFHKGVI